MMTSIPYDQYIDSIKQEGKYKPVSSIIDSLPELFLKYHGEKFKNTRLRGNERYQFQVEPHKAPLKQEEKKRD